MAGINETARLLATLELQDKFSGPARAAEGALGRLEGGFGRLSQGLGQMGRGVGQIGHGIDQIATRAAIAAVGLGTAFVTTAASMQEAFVGTEKTVDATEAQFEQLRQKLRELSVESGTAFEELARIGEVGGALGVGVEDLDEFIDVVNRLGVSTDLTTDAAATALGQLGTILHLTGSEYEAFADTLVALGNAGASTEPQIVELAARFAAAGNRAGLTSDEILALSSAVASMGVEVEAGGTALSQTFNKIALAIGTGSDEVQGFTDVLGISAGEFRRRWETDALGTFQDFLQEIGKLDPIAQAVALDMAGITGVRQLNAVGLMADNWEFVAEQIAITENKTGELGKESDKFFGTASAGFRRVKESVRLAADTVGTELLPILGELGEEFVEFLQDPAQQRAIKAFGEDLAGGLRSFIDEVKRFDFGPLIGTLQGAASIAKGAFDAFRSLPQPIQQLALAAIVANKVTGGAVGSIASGLGNLVMGGLKIAFLDRGTAVNPMWVRQIGLPGTGVDPTRTGGSLGQVLRALGILTVAVPAGVQQAQTSVGSVQGLVSGAIQDVIDTGDQAKIQALRDELQAQLESPVGRLNTFLDDMGVGAGGGTALRTSIDALTAAMEAGTRPPPKVPTVAGGGFDPNVNQRDSRPDPRAVSPFGIGALQDMIDRIKAATRLPDTAMQPLIGALGDLTTELRETPRGKGPFGPLAPDESTLFPPTVQLDPSQVTDLREPTRLAWLAQLALLAQAQSADQANRTYSNFIVSKQEAVAAAVRENTSSLRSKDFAPKFSVTANVTTNVSISEIQRKVTSQSIALGLPVYRDANVR